MIRDGLMCPGQTAATEGGRRRMLVFRDHETRVQDANAHATPLRSHGLRLRGEHGHRRKRWLTGRDRSARAETFLRPLPATGHNIEAGSRAGVEA